MGTIHIPPGATASAVLKSQQCYPPQTLLSLEPSHVATGPKQLPKRHHSV